MDPFLAQIKGRPDVGRGYGTPRLCLIDKLRAGCSIGEPSIGQSSLAGLGANIWWLSDYLDVYLDSRGWDIGSPGWFGNGESMFASSRSRLCWGFTHGWYDWICNIVTENISREWLVEYWGGSFDHFLASYTWTVYCFQHWCNSVAESNTRESNTVI